MISIYGGTTKRCLKNSLHTYITPFPNNQTTPPYILCLLIVRIIKGLNTAFTTLLVHCKYVLNTYYTTFIGIIHSVITDTNIVGNNYILFYTRRKSFSL